VSWWCWCPVGPARRGSRCSVSASGRVSVGCQKDHKISYGGQGLTNPTQEKPKPCRFPQDGMKIIMKCYLWIRNYIEWWWSVLDPELSIPKTDTAS
jgi:hypothetical protein